MRPPALSLAAVPRGAWRLLGRALRREGYGYPSLLRDLRLPDTLDVFVKAWDDRSFPAAARRLRALRPRSASQRLALGLFLSRPLPLAQWAASFRPEELGLLRKTGLLTRSEGARWVFNMAVSPYRGFFFLVDSLPRLRQLGWGGEDLPERVVYFIGQDTLLLAQSTPRARVELAVDLCCGSGVHAVLASLHARSVWAVDINPRAAAAARVNCALNGAENVRVVRGDLWDGAPRGLRFGLIVANPPILLSRGLRKLWRDGGVDGNAVSRRILSGLAGRLAPGGRCRMLAARGIEAWLSRQPALSALSASWTPYPRLVSGNSGLLGLDW